MGEVGPRKRGFIDEVVRITRTKLREHIKLLTMDPGAYADHSEGFRRAFMAQTCVKERGLGLFGPEVAILFDVKNSGEASHRPALRMPPLQHESYGRMIKMVIERFGKNHQRDPATGQARPTPLSSSDIFLLMNGGKDGNHSEFLKPFAGIKKDVKNITLFKDERRSCQRLGKVQGFATLNCVETLLVVQAEKSKLKKITYEHFSSCSTHSNMLGPILMPPFNRLWSLPLKFKRELLGKKALQNNGGQEGDDDSEELDPKPNLKRTPESVEPVFYHGYPTVVYQDILEAHRVRYCIDLTPGDGAAALACYKLGIFYLGLTLTTTHTDQLAAKLEHEVLSCMTNENDDRLYSAALAQTLLDPEDRGRKRSRPDDSDQDSSGSIEPATGEEDSSSVTAANKRYPLAAARAGSWLTDHHAVSSFSGVRRSIT